MFGEVVVDCGQSVGKQLFRPLGWLGIVLVLCSCGGGTGDLSILAETSTLPEPETGSALSQVSVENPLSVGGPDESELLIGVFIDAPVSNLSYISGDIVGKTNESGEFRYRAGDTVKFSIGKTRLPEVLAKDTLTPLDLFNTNRVTHVGVTNVSRLLQTLDADGNAGNGIQIREDVDEKLTHVEIELNDREVFDSTIAALLADNGINVARVVNTAEALTHLSNSLLENDLIELAAIDPDAEFSADTITGQVSLIDSDGDGAADIFDTDDDNDNIPDTFDEAPLVVQENVSPREFAEVVEQGKFAYIEVENETALNQSAEVAPDVGVSQITTASESDQVVSGQELDSDKAETLTEPDSSEVAVTETVDNLEAGASAVETDREPLTLKEQLLGGWLHGCAEINLPYLRDFNYVTHSEIFEEDVVKSVVAFYKDEQCETLSSSNWSDAVDIHLFDVEYGSEIELQDGSAALAYTFTKIETLNSSMFGAMFYRNNFVSIENGVAFYGVSDVTNIIPVANRDMPYHMADSLPIVTYLEDRLPTGVWASDPDYGQFDRDWDGVRNAVDQLPDDAAEVYDYDKDGIGNNADPDDDNDGIPDLEDAAPFEAIYGVDTDGDGEDDYTDPDNDNDGADDAVDSFPLDPDETSDFDGDSIGDNTDWDDDGDGIEDANDTWSPAFTLQMDAPWIKIERYRPAFGDYYYPAFSLRKFMTQGKRWGRHEVFFDHQLDASFRLLSPVYATKAYLHEREVDVAIAFESALDAREMSVVVEGVLLSMRSHNQRSVRLRVPEGTQFNAVYTEANGVTTEVTEIADDDLFASAEDGSFSLDFGSIERKLSNHGYNNFLNETGHFTVTSAMSGVDFDISDGGVLIIPEQYSISVGDITVTGPGVLGYLTNR